MQSLPYHVHPQASARLSRRKLVSKCTLGAGLVVLAGSVLPSPLVGTAQVSESTPDVSATPGPTVEPMALGPTVQSKAAELDYDLAKIFRFVSEEVRYEPYSGALRGANGTLWSLAGNSVDKSILMGALLDESLIEYRFAVGRLTPDQVVALTTAAMATVDEVLLHSAKCSIAATDPRNFGSLAPQAETVEDVPLTPGEELEVDAIRASGGQALSEAQSKASTHVALIGDALRDGGITIPEPADFVLPTLEIERHIWIQIIDGTTWVDYDPTVVRDAAQIVDETYIELPDEFHHTVDIKLVAEELIAGRLQRRELVRLYGNASALVNVPVAILAQPPIEFEAVGLTFNQLVTGNLSLIPYIFAGDIAVVADRPIVFGSNGPSILGALADESTEGSVGEGETLSVWLDIQQSSPGEEPVNIERALLDRLGAELRLQPIDLADPTTMSAIQPVKLVEFYDGNKTIEPLASVYLLNTELARLDFNYALSDAKSTEIYGAATLTVPGMTTLRDTLRLTSEIPTGFQSVIRRPEFTLTSLSLVEGAEGSDSQDVEFCIDLLMRHPYVVPTKGASAETELHPAVLAGVLDQISEHQLVSVMEAEEAGATRTLVTVTEIFDLAIEQSVPVITVTTADDLTKLDLDEVSLSLLERGLAQGFLAVTPVRPILINGEKRAGWWFIHPQTGQTRDQLDSGKSGASVTVGSLTLSALQPRIGIHPVVLAEDAKTRQVSASASKPFRKTLCGRIAIAFAAAAMTLSAGAMASTGNALGAINQFAPYGKALEERKRTQDVVEQARRVSRKSC